MTKTYIYLAGVCTQHVCWKDRHTGGWYLRVFWCVSPYPGKYWDGLCTDWGSLDADEPLGCLFLFGVSGFFGTVKPVMTDCLDMVLQVVSRCFAHCRKSWKTFWFSKSIEIQSLFLFFSDIDISISDVLLCFWWMLFDLAWIVLN